MVLGVGGVWGPDDFVGDDGGLLEQQDRVSQASDQDNHQCHEYIRLRLGHQLNVSDARGEIANRAERIRTSDLLTPRLARTPEAVSEQEQRCHRSHRYHRCRKRSKHDSKERAQLLDWARVDFWVVGSRLLAGCSPVVDDDQQVAEVNDRVSVGVRGTESKGRTAGVVVINVMISVTVKVARNKFISK